MTKCSISQLAWPEPKLTFAEQEVISSVTAPAVYWLVAGWRPSSGLTQSIQLDHSYRSEQLIFRECVCAHTDSFLQRFLFSVCLHSVWVCHWVQGVLAYQWTHRLVDFWKTFAPQSSVFEPVCEGLAGIVTLKGLMWRLMLRDNTGFVSIVPTSLVSYSLTEVYSDPTARGEGGGGIPVMRCGEERNPNNCFARVDQMKSWEDLFLVF